YRELRPGPNPASLAIVLVEVVKLPRGGARDDRRLAVPPDSILGDLLVRRVDIEHRDIAAATLTYPSASASLNFSAISVGLLGPIFCHPLVRGLFVPSTGNVNTPRAA